MDWKIVILVAVSLGFVNIHCFHVEDYSIVHHSDDATDNDTETASDSNSDGDTNLDTESDTDTNTEFDDNRPCPLCGDGATIEGYDPCLGYLSDCESACCGHGVEEPYYVYEE